MKTGPLVDPDVTAICAVCSHQRSVADLLEVHDPRGRHRRWICRPAIDTSCFRIGVGPAAFDEIAPADVVASSPVTEPTQGYPHADVRSGVDPANVPHTYKAAGRST